MHARVDEACPSTGSSGTANVVELLERAASGEGGVENVVISSSCRFQNESSRESVRQATLRRSTMPPPPPPPSGTVLRVDMSSQHSAEMSMGPFFVTRISNPTHGSTQPMDNYATARTEVHIADVIVVEWNSEYGRRAPATDSYSDRRTVR